MNEQYSITTKINLRIIVTCSALYFVLLYLSLHTNCQQGVPKCERTEAVLQLFVFQFGSYWAGCY